jgi:hypothetical protein
MTEEKEVAETPEVAETTQEVVEQEQKSPEVRKEPDHWKQANEVLRLQKQRIEELELRLQQAPQGKTPEEYDEFDKLDPDDMMTVGQAKKYAKSLASKEAATTAKQIVQEYIQQEKIVRDEERMRSKYDDYDYVMEHFALPMIKNDPALAYKVQNSKNPAEVAYKLAKISDEFEEANVKQKPSPKAEKILKNASKPGGSSSVSSSLKTQADDFSKMNPQQVWEMSQKYARGA